MPEKVDMKKEVRVRAAPSPTGRVHIGNIRTYFFNYLLYRKFGGANIFRVENTDKKREVVGGVEAMLEAYQALGIEFNEGPHVGGEYGPYVQSMRLPLYKKYAEELIEKGHAYYCFCSEERLTELRERQKAQKMRPMYDEKCRNIPLDEAKQRVKAGEPYVVRMKVPEEGYTECNDLIYGKFRIKNSEIEDQVLLKADGFPTYHLAVVVDDHLMKISLVTRGREWMPSYPKHILLYNFLGWELPEFAHVPVILNPDGKGKLSKRHGAMPAIAYLRKGYLKEAILNYIMLCGWSPEQSKAHKDEIYTVDELIELFDIRKVHKTSARYDQKKFDYINGMHIRRFTDDLLADHVLNWAENIVMKGFIADQFEEPQQWEIELREKVAKYFPLWKKDMKFFITAVGLVRERIVILSDIVDSLAFLYEDELKYNKSDFEGFPTTNLVPILKKLWENINEALAGGWKHESWESAVRKTADEFDWKHGDMFMLLRLAVAGRRVSPPLFEAMELMGKEKNNKFVQDTLNFLSTMK